jgi:hypothetical protein
MQPRKRTIASPFTERMEKGLVNGKNPVPGIQECAPDEVDQINFTQKFVGFQIYGRLYPHAINPNRSLSTSGRYFGCG